MTGYSNPLHVAREASHMAKSASERDAMLLQKVSVGAICLMALPCALQAVREIFKLLNERHKGEDRGHGR